MIKEEKEGRFGRYLGLLVHSGKMGLKSASTIECAAIYIH